VAAPTWTDVVGIAPELASLPGPAQNEILAIVDGEVHEDVWEEQYRPGFCYLAAHLATLSKKRGLGPVTAQASNGISQSYASMLSVGALGLTSYGLEYSRRTRLLTQTAFGLVT
jgi:hypothetical protein